MKPYNLFQYLSQEMPPDIINPGFGLRPTIIFHFLVKVSGPIVLQIWHYGPNP